MRVGIIGLPNVGKSSLFNLLTKGQAKVDSYPFTTIEKNVGVVTVPDLRLEQISQLLHPEKVTPAHIDFVDIAGLVKGASQGEGLGNRFLAHIREAHLLLHLVRNFPADEVSHVFDAVNPDEDAQIVENELALADLAIVEKRLEHVRKEPKSPEREHLLQALEKLYPALEQGFARPELSREELSALKSLNLFVTKPMLYGINCSDTIPTDPEQFPRLAQFDPVLFSCALELATVGFAEDERRELRTSLGLTPEGPQALVERSFKKLNIIRFYTVKGTESRAWAAPLGTTALDAAAMIHSDLASGFIKAEVLHYTDLVSAGGFQTARETGKVKIEGKNYLVQDGDILLIRFRN